MSSKRDAPTTLDLNDFLAKAEERTLTISAGKETFTIPAPDTWSDEVVNASREEEPIAMARALLGDQWEAWTSAGGNASIALAMIGAMTGMNAGNSQASP